LMLWQASETEGRCGRAEIQHGTHRYNGYPG
jgi:hypothetical protein